MYLKLLTVRVIILKENNFKKVFRLINFVNAAINKKHSLIVEAIFYIIYTKTIKELMVLINNGICVH